MDEGKRGEGSKYRYRDRVFARAKNRTRDRKWSATLMKRSSSFLVNTFTVISRFSSCPPLSEVGNLSLGMTVTKFDKIKEKKKRKEGNVWHRVRVVSLHIYIYIPPISSKFFRFFLELRISLFRGKEREEIRPSFFKRDLWLFIWTKRERERIVKKYLGISYLKKYNIQYFLKIYQNIWSLLSEVKL